MIKAKDEVIIEAPDYTDEEAEQLSDIKQQATKAYDQRQQRFSELDDMTYDEFYITNAKAANGYIPPKNNPEEIRIVSGTTREKGNALLSALLNYNLEADIEAFDEEEMPVQELGNVMEDMIKKSRLLETPIYDVKRPLIYGEYIAQGTVFVREAFVENTVARKKIENMNVSDLTKMKWKESLEQISGYCCSELLCGLNVYLGNIREFFIELQPYIVLRRELTRLEAKSIYGGWNRWDNVPIGITQAVPPTTNSLAPTYNNWSMVEVANEMVEEILYFNKWTNTFQILLNGTLMLPVGFPLEALTGVIDYPIAKGDCEPISRFFAYSRSVASKNKVPQAMFDEMLKAIMLKTRKSHSPSMANNTGMTLTRKIFYPANITDNIDPTKLQPIGDNNGVNQADFNALEFIKGIIDEGSISSIMSGDQPKGSTTAREVVELKQQGMMKLGLTILGIINLETKMAWLRLYNILANWTKPIDYGTDDIKDKLKEQFRSMSIDTEFEDGETGKRIIQMTNGDLPHPDQVYAEEILLSKRKGMTIRKVYLNAEELQNIKYTWFITIQPTEKNSSDLRSAVFMDNVTQGMQLFGPEAFNMEYLKKRWANYNRENPEKLFAAPEQAMPMMPPPEGGQQPIPENTQLQDQMMPKPMQKPSLNTLANA